MAVKSCKCVLVSLFALGFCLQLLALAEPCQKGQHWVRAHYRKGYIRADGVNVSATSVVAHCQDNPPSNQNWQVKLATGLPHAWQQGGERTVEWTLEQKERVLDALSPLPQVLLNTAIEGIYRLKTSKIDVDNPAAGFNGQIAIYDPAFSTRQNLSRVMAHEIAHEMYRQFSFADRTEYLNVAGWRVKEAPSGLPVIVPRLDGYVDEECADSPTEDFAKNIEYYLFDPSKLKNVSPDISQWIHKKYGDKFKMGVAH